MDVASHWIMSHLYELLLLLGFDLAAELSQFSKDPEKSASARGPPV
jgi:hypothetical protein